MESVISKRFVFACMQANELQMLRRQYRWLLLQSSHFATLSSYENKTFPQAMARPRSDDITGERLPVKGYRGLK